MMTKKPTFIWLIILLLMATYLHKSTAQSPALNSTKPLTTSQILLTSEAGDKLAKQPNVSFKQGTPTGVTIQIHPHQLKQTISGIGSSFTESSAFVLAHLEKEKRHEVMQAIYGENGANFSLARTVIGSTDFSVKGKYSHASVEGDTALKHFTIAADSDGFKQTDYPYIKDESFDLLPMIKEAKSIKEAQSDNTLQIVASAWTAPPWMKNIGTWFIKPKPENNYQGTGGELLPQYQATYADYLVKYLDAYRAQGVKLWGLTPVNEPNGNSGQWESMHFTPQSQNQFIKHHLGPKLANSNHQDINLLIYDQNRDHLEEWADAILSDKETTPYVYGVAVHWYASTYKVFEKELENVTQKYPQFPIIHTEGTIDDLGKPALGGVADPEGFQESNWFMNDAFWWNKNATDWAYTASWAANNEDHPMYTPVHRYARNIIVSLNHGVAGWIDWNVVLDEKGGPNHAGNFCGAPIMIDAKKGIIYYTPIFDVLKQFSRTIRPGDTAVQTDIDRKKLGKDTIHASATLNDKNLLSVQILNTTKKPIQYALQIEEQFAEVTIAANSLQTVQIRLD